MSATPPADLTGSTSSTEAGAPRPARSQRASRQKGSRGRLLRRILLGLLVLILVALAGGYLYAKPLLLTATGYAAHNACAVPAVAGRTDDPAGDLPPNPLVPYLKSNPSSDRSSVSSSIFGFLAGQTAYYNDKAGCTLGAPLTAYGPLTPVTSAKNPVATAPAPTPKPAVAAALATAFGDDLDAAKKKALGTRGIVVLKDGALVGERYGDGFTASTPQLGWSMAKSVTNLLVGRLVQQGKISVSDAKLRPEWTDDRAAITIDQLMRMTSGLAWDETYDLGTPITAMLYLEPDMGGYVAKQPLAHPVGTYQQYSSGSTNVLCSVLRAKTGVGPDLPRKELLAPLGLSSAVWETDTTGLPVCSSYLWATPRDWAAIGQFALQDGQWGGEQLLPSGWMASSTVAQAVAKTEDPGYAAGWWANRLPDGSLVEPSLPADAYWASGHDGQRIYVVPSEKLVVVRLGFTPTLKGKDVRTVDLVRDLITATR